MTNYTATAFTGFQRKQPLLGLLYFGRACGTGGGVLL